MRVYILVSSDKYEHIKAIAETVKELAELCGVNKNTVESSLSHYRKGRWSRYQEVEIDE